MRVLHIARSPYTRLLINCAYAIGNCAVGFLTHSWWFITVGAYYVVLTITRFSIFQMERKAAADTDVELFAKKLTGILLVVMSVCIAGVTILSAVKERGTVFHEIVMISIATYTFTKITMAIIGMVKAKHSASPTQKTLRNIALADACVSIYSMQRSMLVSFPGMKPAEIQLMNILTGVVVCLIVLLLGIHLIGGRIVTMAKSKIVKATQKVAEVVTDGYKKIENGVVGGYTKIEDKFVEAYLTRDGETVAEAKARLKKDSQ